MTQTQQKSYMANASTVNRKCILIDADGQILGKVATKAASILRGKHKPTFTPHVDTGDMVVIINAEKVRVTGKKLQDKVYKKYTGYPSGLKSMNLETMLKRNPVKPIELAVKRMLPKGALGNDMFRKLKVYAGEEHPHKAQKPEKIEL